MPSFTLKQLLLATTLVAIEFALMVAMFDRNTFDIFDPVAVDLAWLAFGAYLGILMLGKLKRFDLGTVIGLGSLVGMFVQCAILVVWLTTVGIK